LLFLGIRSPEQIVGLLIAVTLGVTLHEAAHSYFAYFMGDPTPKETGHLTLDPRVHIYLPGWIMFILIGFGTLGLAPINPYRMRNPRLGSIVATGAGPVSNLVIAIVFAIPLRLIVGSLDPSSIGTILRFVVFFNVLLFVFNLLPLFPLDGWHIMLALLPPELAITWDRHRQTSQMVFFILLIASFMGLPFFNFGTIILDPVWNIYTSLLNIPFRAL